MAYNDSVNYKDKLRAFVIMVNNTSVLRQDKYIVLAHTYEEAEELYWNTLNGYYEIASISLIEDVEGVAAVADASSAKTDVVSSK